MNFKHPYCLKPFCIYQPPVTLLFIAIMSIINTDNTTVYIQFSLYCTVHYISTGEVMRRFYGTAIFMKAVTSLLPNLHVKRYTTMKKGMLLLLLVSSVFANAQSLKEALYGGKLKNQPGTVIRKGDDLSSKIDTTHTVATDETSQTNATSPAVDSATTNVTTQTDPAAVTTTDKTDN